MARRILVTGHTLTAGAVEQLTQYGFEVERVPGDLTEEALIGRLRGAWGYVLGGSERASGRILAAATGLRVLCFLGTGYQTFIDVAAARAHGVSVTYTPHASTGAVAEMALGLMIALQRRIPALNGLTKRGAWREDPAPSLFGRTLGVVGMGRIGQQLARMCCRAFEMQVLFWNRTPRPEIAEELGARQVDLPTLLAAADVVSLHCAYDERATRHLLGEAELAWMKPSAILVNVARAEIVEPVALRSALEQRQIAGAAFDGYYVEPAPSADCDPYGLLRLPDSVFLVTPHTAYLTTEAIATMSEMAVANLVAVASGAPPPHPLPA